MTSWSTALPDWRERIVAGRSLVPDLPLIEAEADRGVKVFDSLRLADVPGTPTNRDACGDWFRDVVRAVFGSYDPRLRRRMIREFFVLVPKKNSKTTGGALVMLTALLLNRRPNAEFYLFAPTQKIAEDAFGQIEGAIALDDFLGGGGPRNLKARLYVQGHIRKITESKTGATLEVRSFDPKTATGIRPAGALIDETHVIGPMNNADRVIRQIRGGMVSQPESFLFQITTQSERPPVGVFKDELVRAREVRDGKRPEALLPVLYEFPPEIGRCVQGDDGLYPWEHPRVWHIVNPNFGRSNSLEALHPLYEKAKATSLDELRGWASQHLNVEIGDQLTDESWSGAPRWCEEEVAGLSLDDVIARSEVLVIGIDDGGSDDLLSAYVIGRDADNPRIWWGWGRSWAQEKVLTRRKAIAAQLRDYAGAGELVIATERGGDVAGLVEFVRSVDASEKLDSVALDETSKGPLVDLLVEAGISDDPAIDRTRRKRLIGVPQGYALGGALATLDRKLSDGTFRPAKQKLVQWAVCNAKVLPRGTGLLVTKMIDGIGKIDPFMASLCAADRMADNPAAQTKSFWEVAS